MVGEVKIMYACVLHGAHYITSVVFLTRSHEETLDGSRMMAALRHILLKMHKDMRGR